MSLVTRFSCDSFSCQNTSFISGFVCIILEYSKRYWYMPSAQPPQLNLQCQPDDIAVMPATEWMSREYLSNEDG